MHDRPLKRIEDAVVSKRFIHESGIKAVDIDALVVRLGIDHTLS